MKILIILPTMKSGGTEWQTAQLVSELRIKFEILIWTFQECEINSDLFHRFSSLPNVKILFGKSSGIWRVIRFRPNVMISYAIGYYYPEILIRLICRPRFITERRNLYHWMSRKPSVMSLHLLRNYLTDVVICNSCAVAGEVRRHEPEVINRVRVIHNGVNQCEPGVMTSQRKKIIAVGNIKVGKGYDRVFPLFFEMQDKWGLHGYEFEIYGRVDDKTIMPSEVFEQGRRFLKGEGDARNIYRSACIIVHLSEAEGFPNSVLEAASHGVVPLLSNLPVHVELFEPGSVFSKEKTLDGSALNELIELHHHDFERFAGLSKCSKAMSERYSINRRISAYLEVIE